MRTSVTVPLKSKRGRPKGSKNKPKDVATYSDEEMFKAPKKRGRPPKKHLDSIEPIDDFNILEEELQKIEKIKDHTIELKKKEDKNDKKKYYVDTKRLELLIEQYCKDGKIIDELAIALYNIAYRMSFLPNFINYSWREEMIGDGLVKEFTALQNKKYDASKGRAFSYFSMIVFNAFCNKIKKENKNTEVLKDYQKEQYDSLIFEQEAKNNNQHNDDPND